MATETKYDLPVVIIGAGVAGLTLAQGLRRHSIPFRLFERNPKSHGKQGHRFRIFKDSLAALDTVLPSQSHDLFLRTGAERPRADPRVVEAKSLSFPPETTVQDVRTSSKPIDRAWFRALMTLGIEDAIEYEKTFSSYSVDLAGEVCVSFSDNSSFRGCLLVGADGINSRVRTQLQPDRKLLDLERWIMWGRVLLRNELREQLSGDLCSWFMALDKEANSQAILEPMIWPEDSTISAKDSRLWVKPAENETETLLPAYENYIYWVLSSNTKPTFSLPKSPDQRKLLMQETTREWDQSIQSLLNSASQEDSACVPVLSSKPDIEIKLSEYTGKITLIGDAAHPMSPMGGSAADTAILSAVDLSKTIGEFGVSSKSIGDFESRMKVRADEKIRHSFGGGKTYWQGKNWSEYKEMAS